MGRVGVALPTDIAWDLLSLSPPNNGPLCPIAMPRDIIAVVSMEHSHSLFTYSFLHYSDLLPMVPASARTDTDRCSLVLFRMRVL